MLALATTLILAVGDMNATETHCAAIVTTSDLHGRIEPFVLSSGKQQVRYGGLLAQAGYVAQLRERYGNRLVLLDSGDLYQGTLASNVSQGRAMVRAYEVLGYDGVVVGNHEFDYGPSAERDPDRLGIIKQRIAEAKFPFLAINIYERATYRPVRWPGLEASVLIERGGLKIGVIGAITPDTPTVTRPINIATLDFPAPAPLVLAEARRLRNRGAQLIVLAAHMGGACKEFANPGDLTSCDERVELFDIIRSLPEGTIDVALGGHTHAVVAHWVNGVAALQAGSSGRQVAWIEACPTPQGGIDRERSKIFPPVDACLDEWTPDGGCRTPNRAEGTRPARFLDKPVTPPPPLTEALEPFLAEVRTVQEKPLGVVLPTPLLRESGNVVLGDLVAESLRAGGAAAFGVQNVGGVRADLPAGSINYGQVYEVLPFGNKLVVLVLPGSKVRGFVEQLIKRRGKPPFLSGLRAVHNNDGWQITETNGKPLDDTRRYRLATNDFLMVGGEGLDAVLHDVPDSDKQETDIDMRDAFIGLLQKRFPAGKN